MTKTCRFKLNSLMDNLHHPAAIPFAINNIMCLPYMFNSPRELPFCGQMHFQKINIHLIKCSRLLDIQDKVQEINLIPYPSVNDKR